MKILFAIALVFILLDIASGLIKAFATDGLDSSKMRQGLYHKAAEILLMIVGVVSQYAISFSELAGLIPEGIFDSVIIYVIAMELISILENVSAANPNLNLAKLLHLFGQDKEDKNV